MPVANVTEFIVSLALDVVNGISCKQSVTFSLMKRFFTMLVGSLYVKVFGINITFILIV